VPSIGHVAVGLAAYNAPFGHRGASHSLVLAAALGLVAALGLSRLLAGLLYGVAPTDPPTYALICALLVGVAALASWLPARRAARVDPVIAMRVE